MSFLATATGNLEKASDLVTNPDGSVLVRAKMKVEVEDQSPDHDIENPAILADIIVFGENAKSLANLSEADTVSLALRAGVVKCRDGPEPRARYGVERIMKIVPSARACAKVELEGIDDRVIDGLAERLFRRLFKGTGSQGRQG